MSRALLAWGGLDFDTAELDLELRAALAAISPVGGALRALQVTASMREALAALDADAGEYTGGAAGELGMCLERLEAARVQLVKADEALRRARRTLGLS